MRTYNTACIYYHKFRLVLPHNEYHYNDAAAAALFAACKIEDTLKKSREIVCASNNLRIPPSEHLTPDDPVFETSSKLVIGVERLMLEASGFDYRNRYPQKYLNKIGRKARLDKDVLQLGYNILLDLYRTFAPLKQTSSTMAFACLKLATLLLCKQRENLIRDNKITSRHEVMETVLDLLDLYTQFQKNTIVGPKFPMDAYIPIRIKLNQEAEEKKIKRHTEWINPKPTNGVRSSLIKTPKTPITPASPSDARAANAHPTTSSHPAPPAGDAAPSPGTLSPISSGGVREAFGARGQKGTVRFMLDVEKAKKEKQCVAEYFKVEFEEYEVEVEEAVVEPPPKKSERPPGPSGANNVPVGPSNRFASGGASQRGGGGWRPNGPSGFHSNKKARYK